jgi:hypothetical protein
MSGTNSRTIFGTFADYYATRAYITSTAERIRNLFAQKTQTPAEWEEIPEKKQGDRELSKKFLNNAQTI